MRSSIPALIFQILSPVFFFPAFSQLSAIGEWRLHLPYLKASLAEQAGSKIYCVADDNLFYFDKAGNSIQRFSKINGLSDATINAMAYYPAKDMLLVSYSNANMDLITDGVVYNIPDIKLKSITGAKTINHIYFNGDMAYLSCSFGIVVLNLIKREVKDTWYIGPNGGALDIGAVALDASQWMYAAAKDGVYRADINDPNIGYYANWTKLITAGTNNKFNHIVFYGGKIIANHSHNYENSPADTARAYDGTNWTVALNENSGGHNYRFHLSDNLLAVSNGSSVNVYDQNLARIDEINSSDYGNGDRKDAVKDGRTWWIADSMNGLVRFVTSSDFSFIVPEGPRSVSAGGLKAEGGIIYIAHGPSEQPWFQQYKAAEVSVYKNGFWKNITRDNTPALNGINDFVSIETDKNDPHHFFAGSLGNGLVEIKDGAVVNIFNTSNSSLQQIFGQVRVNGLAYDDDQNLWVANCLTPAPLSVRKADGSWLAFSFPGVLNTPTNVDLTDIMINSYGQKWIIVPRLSTGQSNGILVFDDNYTIDDKSDDQYKLLNDADGNGGLPSSQVYAMAEDHDGQVWVGTAKGIAVFYSPSLIFSNENFDAQQILIFQDGAYQYLLETEVVTAIAVDGANRKWIGTEAGGVFLMSPDGTSQIRNFNIINSPLISNKIYKIAIDHKSGEVYFATDKGLVSYRSDATEGGDGFENVFVYPNPVRENYAGPIAISGLVENTNVKIADISGSLVYETTSLGGQAIWYGTNFEGRRVQTGVYMVYCASPEGDKKAIAKILLIN